MCTFSHSANANSVYTVKVAAVSAGGSGPYSDNIYVYIPTAGKYYCFKATIITYYGNL